MFWDQLRRRKFRKLRDKYSYAKFWKKIGDKPRQKNHYVPSKTAMDLTDQDPFVVDEGGGEDPSESGPAGADQCFCKLEGKGRNLETGRLNLSKIIYLIYQALTN